DEADCSTATVSRKSLNSKASNVPRHCARAGTRNSGLSGAWTGTLGNVRIAVCRSTRIPCLCLGTIRLKFWILPQVLRKILFVGAKRRANQVMKSVLLHFLARFFCRPALDRDAIGGDHHPGAVIAIAAVHEDFLTPVLVQQR